MPHPPATGQDRPSFSRRGLSPADVMHDAGAFRCGAHSNGADRIGSSGRLWSASIRRMRVQYTISSRGRPIGTTALDFMRIDGANRSGWFHPNGFGAELMPAVALVLPAMRAFLCRNVRGDDGQPIVQESARRSSLFADLAEALHRVDAMELTLHRPDGTLVPTSLIGLQDTEGMRELAEWKDFYPAGEVPSVSDE